MIYLDTSVVLAHLFAEDEAPPADLWEESLVTSRLLEYETWTRIHSSGLKKSHGELVRGLLARLAILEMSPPVLVRAVDPFPLPVRTLDAIHLASADFLRGHGQEIVVATYDKRVRAAAEKMNFEIYSLGNR